MKSEAGEKPEGRTFTCAGTHPRDPKRKSRQVNGDPILCAACTNRLRGMLAELPGLASVIMATSDGYSHDTGFTKGGLGFGGGPASRGERRSPSVAVDVILSLEAELSRWTGTGGDLRRPGIGESVGWLMKGNLTALYLRNTDQPNRCWDLNDDVRKWHRRITGMSHVSHAAISKPVPCGQCGKPGLTWVPGAEKVRCRLCNWSVTLDHYEVMAEHGAARAEEIARARVKAARARGRQRARARDQAREQAREAEAEGRLAEGGATG